MKRGARKNKGTGDKEDTSGRQGKDQDSGTLVIPLTKEEVSVGKSVVEGKVHISKRVREKEELIDVPLLSEKVTVTRVPVNQYVEKHPTIRHEEGETIIPVVEERLVVQKRLLLVEELRVSKRTIETRDPKSVTLRSEEIDVRRTPRTKI